MNYKYFGNALDLLKYDLLTYLVKEDNKSLFYVPLITEPLPKAYDPKYLVYEIGNINEYLLKFLRETYNSDDIIDISHIRTYFDHVGIDYSMFSRMRGRRSYFDDDTREIYFSRVIEMFSDIHKETVVFADPDVGSDVGLKRRFRSNKQMYIKREEVSLLKDNLKQQDYLAFFQHLGNSQYTIEDRLRDLKETFGEWILITGYQRIQGSLVFIFNDETNYRDKSEKISNYFKNYEHLKHKEKILML